MREIWARIRALAPESVAAHARALAYWLPRWRGSDELAAGFVAETLAAAAPGSLLTSVQLQYLYVEGIPEVGAAIDAAVADLAAAAPDHPYRANHRHWLAYFLTKAGRHSEALEEFRAIDGYAGARPWDWFDDPAGTLASVCAEAIAGSGAAGR